VPKRWDREKLLETAWGFASACVLAAAEELDVFGLLADAPADAEAVAERAGGDLRGMTILLDALAAMGLLRKREGAYSLPEEVRESLLPGGEACILPAVRHIAGLLPRWAALGEIARGGRPHTAGKDSVPRPGGTEAFIEAMHVFASPQAGELVKRIDLAGATRLLDVGGGPGTFTIAFLQAKADLSAVLFDLPEPIEIARRHVSEAGLTDRVELVAGDFTTDELPGPCDLAWVSAIIHQNSRPANRDLFAKVRRALAGGGRIVIRDHVMDASHTVPLSGAMFAVNMLVATPGGGTYAFEEIREDLTAAGFTDVTLLDGQAEMSCLVTATAP